MIMNNKKTGSDFEKELCSFLSAKGCWVHFLNPDAAGAQPFDVIAVKNNAAYAIDCKTCAAETFSLSRLESNQIMAFEKWLRCGSASPLIAIKHNDDIYCVAYSELRVKGYVRIATLPKMKDVIA